MASTKLEKFCRKFEKVSLSYCDPKLKDEFHTQGKAALVELAEELGLTRLDYDLRSNKAGIAVSGEVTLHAERIYIQISQCFSGSNFLIRSCKGRKDYSGGVNNNVKFSSPAIVLQVSKRVLDIGH